MKEDKKQAVRSSITFPLGQDWIVITRAISDLLNDGWNFTTLAKDKIILTRGWDYDPTEELIGSAEVERTKRKRNR